MPEDNKDQAGPVERKPNLLEIMKAEEEDFGQSYIFVWWTDPTRDIVRVSLDDGVIRLHLRRQKFLDLMLSIMDINKKPTDYNYFRIKESLGRYGGWFHYDRMKDEFKELQEKPNFRRITPRDLIDGTRADFERGPRDSDRFVGLAGISSELAKIKSPIEPRAIRDRSPFHRILRNFDRKKKS